MKDNKRFENLLSKKLEKIGYNMVKFTIDGVYIDHFKPRTSIDFGNKRLLIGNDWLFGKYMTHADYWGYDKMVELSNIIVRAFCLLGGNPLDEKDLPFSIGVARHMLVENLLIGIEYQEKNPNDTWSNVKRISSNYSPKIIGAMNVA